MQATQSTLMTCTNAHRQGASVGRLVFWLDGSAGVTSTSVTPRYTSIPGLRLDVGMQAGVSSSAAQALHANALRFGPSAITSASDVGGRLVNFSVPESFSVEGWLFPEALGGWWRWICWGNGQSQRNIIIAQDGTPNGTTASLVFMYEDNLVRRFSLISPGVLNQNVWVHIACTYDATTRRAALYVNGELTNFATSTSAVPAGPRTNMFVGRSNWGADSSSFFKTSMRVYDYALTEREVVALCTGVESDGLALYANPASAVNNVVMPYVGTSAVNWLVAPTRLTRNGAQLSGPSVNLDGPTAAGTSYDIRFALANWSGDGLSAKIGGGPDIGLVAANGQVARRATSTGGNVLQFVPWGGASGTARVTALTVRKVVPKIGDGSMYSSRIPAWIGYSGPLWRVRRLSDSAELDIGAAPNADANGDRWLDQSALIGFVGTGSAVLVTWYDISGNGRHAYQPDTAKAPIVLTNGVIEVANGKPAIRPSGTNSSLTTTASLSAQSGVVCFGPGASIPANTFPATVCPVGANRTTGAFVSGSALRNAITNNNPTNTAGAWIDGAAVTSLASFTNFNAGQSVNTAVGHVVTINLTSSVSSQYVLLADSAFAGRAWQGPVHEIVLPSAQLSAEVRQIIERSQGAAYGITI